MPLHLIKLCVGCDSQRDLEDWIAERRRARGGAGDHVHVTRMMPKRGDEIVGGGSLFWVIRGQLACRQRLLSIAPIRGEDGVSRCALSLEPRVVPVSPRPVRPFQGWRYLAHDAAPADLGGAAMEVEAMPEGMRRELATLGLL